MEKSSNNVPNKKIETKKTRSGKKDYKEKKKRKKHEILRIVIRQLPPTITKEDLLNDISPLPEHTEFYIGRGCPEYKDYHFSRAYIAFKKFEDLLTFKDRFDGYVFLNDKGHEYTAIVEFSPLQRMPDFDGLRIKEDPKMNTYENDPEYIEFMEALKQPVQKNTTSPDAILEEIQNRNASHKTPQVTPLMEYLVKRHEEERRKKEEKKKKRNEEKKLKKKDDKGKNKPKKDVDNKADKKDVKVLPKKNKPIKETKVDAPKYKILAKKPAENASSPEMKPSTSSGIKVLQKTDQISKQIVNKSSNEVPSASNKPSATFTVKVNPTTIKNEPKTKPTKDVGKVKNKDRPDREIYKPKPRASQAQQQQQHHSEQSRNQQTVLSEVTLNSSNSGTNNADLGDTKKRTYRTYIRHKVNHNKPA